MGIKIITDHRTYRNILDHSIDWCAVSENYEPGDPIGFGATEAEAIASLTEEMEGRG